MERKQEGLAEENHFWAKENECSVVGRKLP